MGNTFAKVCRGFIKRLFVDERTYGTQTITKFTERLTNFDSVDLGSTETFDQACNICDLYTEKEAVGYCRVCEQYLCLKCCKHHEKISLSQNHKIVGKEDFGDLASEMLLFDMHLVPETVGYLPECVHVPGYTCYDKMNCYHRCHLLAAFSIQSTGHICYVMCPTKYFKKSDNIEVGLFTRDGSYKRIEGIKKDSMAKHVTIKYFVLKGMVWLMKYDNDGVYYELLTSTSGTLHRVVPFDNGLAILVHIPTGFSLPNWQIQYIDFKGNIKQQIFYDSYGKQLFKSPYQLASNVTEDILFVSDSEENSVIALGPKGNVIYKFTHDSIRYPRGLACDEENNVYVACTNKVIQIDKHGKTCRVLLNSNSDNSITHLCYDKLRKKLAVVETRTVTLFTFYQ